MRVEDSISHLSDSHFHSRAMTARGLTPVDILADIRSRYAGPMLDVAVDPEDFAGARSVTGTIPGIYHSCGLHPSRTAREDWETAMETVARHTREDTCRAVGETGLDWYRMYAPRERQLELFARHVELASAVRRPIIVHNRSADEDTLAVLGAGTLPGGGVMHCFSSAPEWVGPFVETGMYISFAGNVTFKNAGTLREAVKLVPDDRLLVETDAPFLAPHPHRGRLNHPGFLPHIIEVVAAARGTTAEHIARLTAENLAALLGIDLPPPIARAT
jgi:TatD DNase family protein